MTATWARLAASATNVKSLSNESVDGCCAGGGGTAAAAAVMAIDDDDALALGLLLVVYEEPPLVPGDDMGAFIVAVCDKELLMMSSRK